MEGLKDAIREVLFNDWDPIGVGPMEQAKSLGITSEYDDLVDVISKIPPAEETGKILSALIGFREALDLPGLGNDEQVAIALKQVLMND